jgi:hypothetical protein
MKVSASNLITKPSCRTFYESIKTQTVYKIDRNKTKPFDIVLVRFLVDRLYILISWGCNSELSHAIVYLDNRSFIEAFDPIVNLFSAHRYFS